MDVNGNLQNLLMSDQAYNKSPKVVHLKYDVELTSGVAGVDGDTGAGPKLHQSRDPTSNA